MKQDFRNDRHERKITFGFPNGDYKQVQWKKKEQVNSGI